MIESVVLTKKDDGGVVMAMTVDGRTMWDIRRLQHLLKDEVPDGDIGRILGIALDAMVREVKRQGRATP